MTVTQSAQPFVTPSFRVLSGLSSALRRLRAWHEERRALKIARGAFMNLVYQDDRILDDIGVTREEAVWAASLPLQISAALALRERAALRRRSPARLI